MKQKLTKENKFWIDFSICGLCINEVRELLRRAEEKKRVLIRIKKDDGINHIEVIE